MDYVKAEVFNLDGNTQLEFLNRKTVIVIDKDRFSVCKSLIMENAPDEDFSSFLNIPIEKVRYFKYKMQLFEDSIRVRRRAAKLEKRRKKASKTQPVRKREISSEERFRRARDLISRNLSTNQISKILKVSERSVTRFKRRMREEKQRLKAEGKIAGDPNDPDDESSFRHLPPEEKIKTAKELFRKRLKIQEISEILKISERSVRRWKEKLSKLKEDAAANIKTESSLNGAEIDEEIEVIKYKSSPPSKRPMRIKQTRPAPTEDEDDDDEAQDTTANPARKKRRLYVDREKVQYAKELIENKLSNKEMSLLLEMSIACVRKLKMKILNGTVEELIDNSEEHYTKLEQEVNEAASKVDPEIDPLNVMDVSHPIASTSSSFLGYERKPKVVLRDREMFMARMLRDNSIRTMDIAKMMKISERSVTRLLAKTKDQPAIDYDADVISEVEKLMEEKDEILNCEIPEDFDHIQQEIKPDESKRQLGASLIAMNVKSKDIAKMLDVSEKTIHRWKARMQKQETDGDDEGEDEATHPVFNNLLDAKEEVDEQVVYEEFGDYE